MTEDRLIGEAPCKSCDEICVQEDMYYAPDSDSVAPEYCHTCWSEFYGGELVWGGWV